MLGVASRPLLREDKVAVKLDLEDSAARRDEDEFVEAVFEFF